MIEKQQRRRIRLEQRKLQVGLLILGLLLMIAAVLALLLYLR